MQEHRLSNGSRARIGPWRGSADVANLATYADHPLDRARVRECLGELARRGYREVITAALPPPEQQPFLECGLVPLRELALLRRTIDGPPPRSDERFRRWRRRDLGPILAIDRAAFDDFWRFDEAAVRDALEATPQQSLRATRVQPPTGYSLSGVAGRRGYLQRLAVHPDAAGQGLGRALLLDALRWMKWRGAAEAWVNTQTDNERALALYLANDFEVVPGGLAILHGGL